MRPSRVTKRFSGLRSRWTTPRACAAASPRAIWTAKVHRLARGDGAGRKALPQGLAFEKFLDEVEAALGFADVEDAHDVGMVQAAGRARFLFQPRAHLRGGGERRRKHLDGHIAVDPRVARAEDLSHAAGAQLSRDFVGPEPGAGTDWHGDDYIRKANGTPGGGCLTLLGNSRFSRGKRSLKKSPR